jgi:hypothetical protein
MVRALRVKPCIQPQNLLLTQSPAREGVSSFAVEEVVLNVSTRTQRVARVGLALALEYAEAILQLVL